MSAVVRFGLVCTSVIFVAGCNSRISFSKTVELVPGTVTAYEIDAPKADQKVAVEFSADSPVSVIVCTHSDKDAVEAYLTIHGKKLPTVLGQCENMKSGSMSVSVPAKTMFHVLCIALEKKTDMKLNVTSK